ncbi:MobC family replication-relaxation protein, partial [Yersinia enterocolitica]
MLISSDKERKGRNSEKMAQLLNFLKEETYSDFDTLKQLFRYKAHQPLYLLLD